MFLDPYAEIREFLQHVVRKEGLLQKDGAQCCGLTVLQNQILYELGKQQGFSLMELSDIMSVETSTLSRQVQTLVELDLINRVPDSHDRRYVVLSLTSSGREKRSAVSEDMYRHIEGIWSVIPNGKRGQVLESLRLFGTAIRQSVR